MPDINCDRCGGAGSAMGGGYSTNATRSEQLLFLTDDQLRQGIELMFFAYRGFTADPDRILAARGYGRAHHRAIHFINRRPGLTVNELLDFLGVTKQSLNRVLRQLVDDGLVESRVGREDRRHRNLHLTAAGRALRAGAVGGAAAADAGGLLDRRAGGGARLSQGAGADDRPRAARARGRLAGRRPAVTDTAQPHILVVDDDARIRALLQKFLARSGFMVTTARDAAHARRLLEGLEFDLIVLDVMMPGEDGLAAHRQPARDDDDADPAADRPRRRRRPHPRARGRRRRLPAQALRAARAAAADQRHPAPGAEAAAEGRAAEDAAARRGALRPRAAASSGAGAT